MINEIYKNGQLVEIIEVADEVNIEPPLTYEITSSAIADLDNALNDPTVNSISELKSALQNFINQIQNPSQN